MYIVDDLDSVHNFASDLSQLLLSLTTNQDDDDNNDDFQAGLVEMDCEWRPSFYFASSSEPQPVLLCQICLHPLQKVYLLDLQTLLRPLLPPTEPLNELEADVSESVGNLLESTRLIKVGFQVVHDLRQLAASYPHMPICQSVQSVLEASALAKNVMQLNKEKRNARSATSSLSRLTEAFLGKALNKNQQCSDWSQRPLSDEQVEYAARGRCGILFQATSGPLEGRQVVC